MKRRMWLLHVVLVGAVALGLAVPGWAAQFDIARIFIEYNETDNDLGFHVFLDARNWKTVKILDPNGNTIFEVAGKGGYRIGLTELLFEGAEPNLDDFPLVELLGLFPEGRYTFIGETVDGGRLMSRATLSHAVPAGPTVSVAVNGNTVVISWPPVTGPAAILPDEEVNVVAYQVIVGSFQVTIPALNTNMQVTVPTEFVQSLAPGSHGFEVLSIEASGNQTITAGSFVKQ